MGTRLGMGQVLWKRGGDGTGIAGMGKILQGQLGMQINYYPYASLYPEMWRKK